MNTRTKHAIVATSCAVLFAILAFLALSGRTAELDEALLRAYGPLEVGADAPEAPPVWARPALGRAAHAVTLLGSGWLFGLAGALGILFELRRGRRSNAYLLLWVFGGTALLHPITKELFDRARPDLLPHAVFVHSLSFPSGHSLFAAVLYPTLARNYVPGRKRRAAALTVAWILAAAVGLSRPILGVHWPTDVLGGWLLGAAWTALVPLLVDRRSSGETSRIPSRS